jgi:hypothetical protein
MSFASDTAQSHSMGQFGFKHLTTAGTATYATKTMCAIQALTDSTITAESVNGDHLTAVAVLAGSVILGQFKSVTVTGDGGSVLAYLSSL